MSRLGGNLFEQVRFPVVLGDRYVTVRCDAITDAVLVDVYRWDRDLDRLVVELFQGRPLPGAPPVTVQPLGRSGGVRLGAREGEVVGYLSGGDDPYSVVISPDSIALYRGSAVTFEMISSAVAGFPIGVRIDAGGGVAIGSPLPEGFPARRLFKDADVVLTDLVGTPPVIADTDFHRCRLVGPAVVALLGGVALRESRLPPPELFVWELPVASGEVIGAIGLVDSDIHACSLEAVALAVAPGTRDEVIRHLRNS